MKNAIMALILNMVPFFLIAQGLIVNEISNGAAGNQEYYELVVIGSTVNPLGTVNLGGWIIDDNNGDFEGTATTGIATGHIRIRPGFLSAVKPGSIILIYNNAEFALADDPTDANSDCVYIIPINNVALDNNNTNPSTTNSSYIPSVYGALQSWVRIGLRNDGDAAQVRKPDGTFFHGFSYGDVLAPFPNFPSELENGLSFNVMTGTGTGRNYFFNCGNYTSGANFTRGTAPGNETPGLPNNDFNRYFINAVRNGTYNYANLADPANCGSSASLLDCATILNSSLTRFDVVKESDAITLRWEFDNITEVESVEIEKSENGYEFEIIQEMGIYSDLQYTAFDMHPTTGDTYYRLKIFYKNGNYFYSKVVHYYEQMIEKVEIYPNPSTGVIHINSIDKIDKIDIFNGIGYNLTIHNPANIIELPKLSGGIYYLKIHIGTTVLTKKLQILKPF